MTCSCTLLTICTTSPNNSDTGKTYTGHKESSQLIFPTHFYVNFENDQMTYSLGCSVTASIIHWFTDILYLVLRLVIYIFVINELKQNKYQLYVVYCTRHNSYDCHSDSVWFTSPRKGKFFIFRQLNPYNLKSAITYCSCLIGIFYSLFQKFSFQLLKICSFANESYN